MSVSVPDQFSEVVQEADRNIEQVPLPTLDPIYGDEGPVQEHWGER